MVPFDRLIRAVDAWAGGQADDEVVAQIGEKAKYEPVNMKWFRRLDPPSFGKLVASSRLLIAHAGTGSFFLAAERSKPIVMFPRRVGFREHTTDHQVHTARWLKHKSGVYVAMSEDELPAAIASALAHPKQSVEPVAPFAPDNFLDRVRHALTT